MKVAIVVTHLLGIGHLARAAALGRALARAGHEVVLLSGGRPAPNVPMTGIRLVQLPDLHVVGTDFRRLFDANGALAEEALFQERRRLLIATVEAFRPDALVVELFPFGRRQIAAEHEALLAHVRRTMPACAILSSIRDVLAPPSRPAKADFAEETLARFFDGVLAHGDERVLPLEASWPVSKGLQRQMAYTGYVRDAEPAALAADGEGAGEVIVSGGGSAASLPLMRGALEAAALTPGRRWRLLVGHGVPEAEFAALAQSAPANAIVERARKDFASLLARAACSVSQAGYNTMLDLAAAGVPAVIVPFEAGGEREQGIRAERFAAMGRGVVVPESTVSGLALVDAVEAAMAQGAPPEALAMDGAQASVSLIAAAVATRRATAAGWEAVDAALDRIAAAGKTLRVWWRDDDATEPTPRLDRLLEMARRRGAPLALAVIPERATPALAERLAGEADVAVLVHGIAHQNNAQPGAKKQELVLADEITLCRLTEGRARLARMFGAQALPVLVPPWNRIAPGLIPGLGAAGFRGLSTYGDAAGAGESGVLQVNAHLDPVDWRGGGGLVRAPAHIAVVAELLARRAADPAPVLEPVGLLTHHLIHDPWIWSFVDDLLARLAQHRAVRILTARALFDLT